jgi:hypothetical protein
MVLLQQIYIMYLLHKASHDSEVYWHPWQKWTQSTSSKATESGMNIIESEWSTCFVYNTGLLNTFGFDLLICYTSSSYLRYDAAGSWIYRFAQTWLSLRMKYNSILSFQQQSARATCPLRTERHLLNPSWPRRVNQESSWSPKGRFILAWRPFRPF